MYSLGRGSLFLAPIFVCLAGSAAASGGTNGLTDRISLRHDGTQAISPSLESSLSADGRRVAFTSLDQLVPADNNFSWDVYVLDRDTKTLILASATAGNLVGNGDSTEPSISADGNWVAFASEATNFVGFEVNGATSDVFRKDLTTGSILRVSSVGGISANGHSAAPSISAGGNRVAFESAATNLVPGDTNGSFDIFVRDFIAGTTEIVSVDVFGGQANDRSRNPSISADGNRIAFQSDASDLIIFDDNGVSDVFVRDRNLAFTFRASFTPLSTAPNDDSLAPSISANGQRVAFVSRATDILPGDTNDMLDVFWTDIGSGVVHAASVTPGGAFAQGTSSEPKLSGDGTMLIFKSGAQDLVAPAPGSNQIYARDLAAGQTWLVSRKTGPTGAANDWCWLPSVDADGSTIAFASLATNLDQGDTNGENDVFVRDVFADPATHCTGTLTSQGCQPMIASTGLPRASQNAGFVVETQDVPNQKPALLYYGLNGPAMIPFFGGTLCVQPPLGRTPITFSNGNALPANDCTGSLSIDMNAFADGALGGSPHADLSTIGQEVNVQWWGRDPGAVFGVFLTDALTYHVGL